VDSDDEVRDRATLYLHLLESDKNYILNSLATSVVALEIALQDYLKKSEFQQPFDIKTVPEQSVVAAAERPKATPAVTAAAQKTVANSRVEQAEELKKVPELSRLELGPLFKSSAKQMLTESETEYLVEVIKHVYKSHLILQFRVENTLADQILENVKVDLDLPEGFQQIVSVGVSQLRYGSDYAYVALTWPEDLEGSFGIGIASTLKFVVKDCDPETGIPDTEEGYDDEYVLEDIDLNLSDQILSVSRANFSSAWDELPIEREETYALSNAHTIPEAVKNITSYLGMQPCDRSDRVPEGKSSHQLLLAGLFRGGMEVLAKAKFVLSDGVNLQLMVRSVDENIADIITSSVG